MSKIEFIFHKIYLEVESDSDELLDNIRRDFAFFNKQSPETSAHKGQNRYKITVRNGDPQYDSLPAMNASYITPRNVCFEYKGIKYIDHSGKALVIHDPKLMQCEIQSSDGTFLHEICYMTILSMVSQGLDAQHIHRVHALGVETHGQATLILLDSGGGKSTLALRLLSSDENIRLISEDSPFIDRSGCIMPFPIRIGVHSSGVPQTIPDKYQRNFFRQEATSKTLIDIDYFRDKIQTSDCEPSSIIIGKRVLGQESKIIPCSKISAFNEMFKNSVVGLGLYQGIEYVFQKGAIDIFKKLPLAVSRIRNSIKVLSKSKSYIFLMNTNKDLNARILEKFLINQHE